MDVAAPDGVEDLFAGEDAARVLQEELQQAVFGRAQMQRAAIARDAMRVLVHREVMVAQRALLRHAAGPAQQGADAGKEGFHREGLGDVVVGTRIQGANRILVLGPGGDHDDRQVARVRSAAELAADFQARHGRQHPVEQDQVRTGLRDAQQRFLPIGRFLDGEALLFEVVAHQGQQRRLVLHDQDRGTRRAAGHRDGHEWLSQVDFGRGAA